MNTLRWILMIPTSLLALVLGSLLGGMVFSVFDNQPAVDSASAFLGCFALVFTAGLIAPSKRSRTTRIFAVFVILLALVSLFASITTNIEVFTDRPLLQRILIPISQILGALYATFMLPPLVTPGTKLEQFWKEIVALGVTVIFIGIIVSICGLVARIVAGTWIGVATGLGVISLGVATWLLPFVHVFLRTRSSVLWKNYLTDKKEKSSDETSSIP